MSRRAAAPAWLLAALALALAPASLAQTHPDPAKYEYRWIRGRFVPPYTSFPEGRERGRWKCQSENAAAIECSFVRGTLAGFDFIWRRRR